MIFSTDAIIAFSIILLTTLVFASNLANTIQQSTEHLSSFELEEKALLITDSLVKNYSSENTSLGACITDHDKKRVKTNELSSSNLKQAQKLNFEKIFLNKISYETKTRKEIIEIEQKNSKNCLSVKRFALIDGEAGIIQTTICEQV